MHHEEKQGLGDPFFSCLHTATTPAMQDSRFSPATKESSLEWRRYTPESHKYGMKCLARRSFLSVR
jgi:hypothetical protein